MLWAIALIPLSSSRFLELCLPLTRFCSRWSGQCRGCSVAAGSPLCPPRAGTASVNHSVLRGQVPHPWNNSGARIRHSACDSVVKIVSCLHLLFCDSGRPGRFQLFYQWEAGDTEGPLYTGRRHRVLSARFQQKLESSFVSLWYLPSGASRWCSQKEPTSQYRRHKTRGLDPWVGKIP